jgi:hypothetical protein
MKYLLIASWGWLPARLTLITTKSNSKMERLAIDWIVIRLSSPIRLVSKRLPVFVVAVLPSWMMPTMVAIPSFVALSSNTDLVWGTMHRGLNDG